MNFLKKKLQLFEVELLIERIIHYWLVEIEINLIT